MSHEQKLFALLQMPSMGFMCQLAFKNPEAGRPRILDPPRLDCRPCGRFIFLRSQHGLKDWNEHTESFYLELVGNKGICYDRDYIPLFPS